MKLQDREEIWNRAAMEAGGDNPRNGDRALSALLLAHGLIMNGGVKHAIECLEKSEVIAAIDGYKYFSLPEAGEILTKALSASESELDKLELLYGQLVSSDDVLSNNYNKVYATSPNEFSPL